MTLLQDTHPAVAAQWSVEQNLPLSLSTITTAFGRKVWRCRHGHTWEVKVANRTKAHRLPRVCWATGGPFPGTQSGPRLPGGRRYHKFRYRKEKFQRDPALRYEEGMTEQELATLNGFLKVYDSGKVKWGKRYQSC